MNKLKILLLGLFTLISFLIGYTKYYDMNINDIGLTILTWVKKIKGNAVDLSTLNNTKTSTMKHTTWTELLKKYVFATGKVNYQGFIQDKILFQTYLDDLTAHPPGKNWTEQQQLAYWINAYNAFTVKLIIDHYPLKSIKNISDGLPMVNSPWDIKFFKIGEVDFDLNTIEHEILRKQFNEPRIHFAINCASFSCPKLRNEAFTAAKLEAQLEEQAIDFINNPDKNKINKNETKLSKIFDWFKSDFIKKTDLPTFIKKYNPTLNPANEIAFIPYSWTLNE